MFCPQCGHQVDDNVKFCANCGTPIQAPVAAPAPVVEPAPVAEEAPAYAEPVAPQVPVEPQPAYEPAPAPAPQYQPAPQYEASQPTYQQPQPTYQQPQPTYQQYQQPQPQYQYAQPTYQQPEQDNPGNGMGVASLVLGIIALVFCWIPVFDLFLVVPSLALGIVGKIKSSKANTSNGKAIVGIVLAGIALFVQLMIFAVIGGY